MRKFFFFLNIICLTLLGISCGDDATTGPIKDVGEVNINFKATFGGEPLVMNRNYTYTDGTPIFFNRFNFFISDLGLDQDVGTDITELSDVERIDFSDVNIDEASALEGVTLTMEGIPVGDYSRLAFGIGVSQELNGSKPSDYGSTHALSSTSDYWLAWESYIFSKIEGRIDTDGDGMNETGVSYHLGSDSSYREVKMNETSTVSKDNPLTINVVIDLEKILVADATEFLDVKNTTAVHDDSELVTFLMDNFKFAFN